MAITQNTAPKNLLDIGLDRVDGLSIQNEAIISDDTLGGRFTAANGWTVEDGKLPGFGAPVDLPDAFAVIPNGNIFTFKGITYRKLTVTTLQIGNGTNPAIPTSTTGSFVVPDQVQIGSAQYTVTSIADQAFAGSQISGIDLNNGHLQSIGTHVFDGCANLTAVAVPSTVESIAFGAFAGRNGIQSITCQGNICYYDIGGVLYQRLSSDDWTLLAYPSGRQQTGFVASAASVASQAFDGNTYLKNMMISDTYGNFPTTIMPGAITDCPSLTLTVYSGSAAYGYAVNHQIPYTLIPSNVFCSGAVAYKITSASPPAVQVNNVLDTSLIMGDVSVPQTITRNNVTYTVTGIGANAFRDCAGLGNMTLPSTVTSIGIAAFCGSGLKSINIPAAVAGFGDHAFDSCKSLVSVNMAAGSVLSAIGNNVFSSCISLTSISLPDSVVSFGANMFTNCGSLQSVRLPAGITEITAQTFYSCAALQSLTCSPLTAVGDQAFYGCTKLTGISLSANLTSIGASAFRNSGLTGVIIPSGVTAIGNNAFDNCQSLASVTFGSNNTLRSIGSYAFYSCSSLASIDLPDSMETIGDHAFTHCTSLGTVTLPANLTAIQDYTFYNCTALTAIYIPSHVTSIGAYAFTLCAALAQVTMPAGLTDIGYYAFYGCGAYTTTYYTP